jgi:hypothetical protein
MLMATILAADIVRMRRGFRNRIELYSCVALAREILGHWQVSMHGHHIPRVRAKQEDGMTDKSTQPRLDARKVSPDLYKAMAGSQNYIEASGLDRSVLGVRYSCRHHYRFGDGLGVDLDQTVRVCGTGRGFSEMG